MAAERELRQADIGPDSVRSRPYFVLHVGVSLWTASER